MACRADVFLCEFRIRLEDTFHRITAGHHAQNVFDHDARAANHRFPGTNLRVIHNAVFHEQTLVRDPERINLDSTGQGAST